MHSVVWRNNVWLLIHKEKFLGLWPFVFETFVKRATLFKYCRILKRIALSQAFNTVVYFWSDICAAALVIWSVSRCLILWKLASRGSCCLCDHSSRWTHLLDYFCSTLSYVRYSKLNWSHRYSVHVEANIALHFEANITVLEAHRSFDEPLLVCWSDVCAAAPFIWSVRRFFFLEAHKPLYIFVAWSMQSKMRLKHT